MHAYIFQISTEEIRVNIDVDTVTSCNGCDIDYCNQITFKESAEAVEDLVNNCFPKGMFEVVDDDTIRYLGGIEEYAKKWAEDIELASRRFSSKELLNNGKEFRELKRIIRNPFNIPHLFYTDTEAFSCYASMSGEFITDFLSGLKPNDLLHIGGVLDFHF